MSPYITEIPTLNKILKQKAITLNFINACDMSRDTTLSLEPSRKDFYIPFAVAKRWLMYLLWQNVC